MFCSTVPLFGGAFAYAGRLAANILLKSSSDWRRPSSLNTTDFALPRGLDLLVVSALWVVVLIAIGIVFHGVDATVGGAIIAALAGAAGIAKFIESRRWGSKEADNEDAEA
jgi:hypothetical protein